MVVPTRYVQVYANYDKSVVKNIHDSIFYFSTDDKGHEVSKPVLTVFATPERAFAQAAKQIARKRGEPDPVMDAKSLKNVPLPIISISRTSVVFDPSRYVKVNLRKLEYEPTTGKYFSTVMPSPYNFGYQFDVWARNLDVLDDLVNQFLLLLRANEVYLQVEHPRPFGTRIVRTEFNDVVDNSKLETDTDQRTLRKTISITVRGWLCKPEVAHGIVETVITEIYDDSLSEPGVLLDTVVVS